ncbi:MAG: cytidylate kinase family protein [Bacteroidetes bacterium]|nr:cytidylate kinase family protein [Bacteroidota bacterium]
MENLLLDYMERAFSERHIGNQPGPRPVVTISREYGCPSKLLAQLLTNELNRRSGSPLPGKWRFINKEVVEATARRLEMNPTEVNYLISSGGKGLIEDVLASFSPTYVSSIRMRKTVTAVVRSIADQGYVVIVGRGGVGILQNFPNTIHIRLQAPREWRIGTIGQSKNLGRAESSKMVDELDKKRVAFIEMMTGNKFHPYLFDLTFNCSSLSNGEIAGTIMGLMETKNII